MYFVLTSEWTTHKWNVYCMFLICVFEWCCPWTGACCWWISMLSWTALRYAGPRACQAGRRSVPPWTLGACSGLRWFAKWSETGWGLPCTCSGCYVYFAIHVRVYKFSHNKNQAFYSYGYRIVALAICGTSAMSAMLMSSPTQYLPDVFFKYSSSATNSLWINQTKADCNWGFKCCQTDEAASDEVVSKLSLRLVSPTHFSYFVQNMRILNWLDSCVHHFRNRSRLKQRISVGTSQWHKLHVEAAVFYLRSLHRVFRKQVLSWSRLL